MNIDTDAAESALRDIDRAKGRTSAFAAYARSGPAFIVWGLVWLAANSVQSLAPAYGSYVWAIGMVAGVATSIAVGMRGRKESVAGGPSRPVARYVLTGLVIAATISGVFGILGVSDATDATDANAAISLIVAAAYCLFGIWTGSRFLLVGLVLAAAVVGGWVWMKEQFELWIGLVGGGALILTGFWLGRA